MRKLKLFFTCLLMVSISLVNAQTKTASGTVISSEDGLAVIGASVTVKGNPGIGTLTDGQGRYTISVPASTNTLVISLVGMKTAEVPATLNQRVSMDIDISELDEVMVVAYGTTTKKSFTGAASSIRGEKLSKSETSNITKALEGAVSGVQISSATGQPGSSAAIRIRGLGSVSASQSPLIVVDGVPYEGSLNSIAPQDIETLNVLKDAAANSMYGARGSNGVILITTKSGSRGKVKINFDTRVGVNSRGIPAYDVIKDPKDYYEMIWEAGRNNFHENAGMSLLEAGVYTSNNLIPNYLGYNIYKNIDDSQLIDPITGKINSNASEKKWNDNWMKDPFRNGPRQEYNLNVSGGNDNTSAFMSLGYLNDKGYIYKSDFSRLNSRVKIDQKFNNNFKAGLNIAYTQTVSNAPVDDGGSTNYSNIFMFTQSIAPIFPIYKYDLATGAPLYDLNNNRLYDFGSGAIMNGVAANRTRAYAAEQNPMYKLENDNDESKRDNISSRAYAEVKFLKDFKFTANIAYDVFNTVYTSYVNPLQGDGKTYQGIGDKSAQRYSALNANQLLNYTKTFGLNKITALAGHETKSDNSWYLAGTKMRYYDPYNPEFANAGAMSALTSYTSGYRLEGYLSRLEYDYADKYYVSGSLRYDGSSKFHPDVRWGTFWSVGAAWRVNEENFLKSVDQISNLRLKASYGTQGNDGISGSNLYIDQYTLVSDGTNASPTLSYRGAPGLTWEKSNNFNVGFELGLFKRLNLNVDFFIKETKDMIYAKPLPPSMGSPTWIWDNQIDMKNSGIEAELIADIVKTKNINWDVAINLTSYKNEITKVPDDKDPEGYKAGSYWRKVGGSLYDFYMYQNAGVNPETGAPMWYRNDDEDNKVTTEVYADATEYEIGKSSIPTLYGGLSTNLKVYGFDLGIQTAYQLGGYVYDGVYAGLMSGGDYGENWSTDIFKRWTPTNKTSTIPRVSTGDQNVSALSDRFLIDASYFTLKNISVGYTLPADFTRQYSINAARIYLTGDNLWLASARKGLDPRQSFSGSVYTGVYSALRTLSVGLSLSF